MGGLYRSLLPEILKQLDVAPPTGQVWTATAVRSTEHTLQTLGFLDTAHAPLPDVASLENQEAEALRVAAIPGIFRAFAMALPQRDLAAHRIDSLRLQLRLAVFANDVHGFYDARSRLLNLLDPYAPLPRPLKEQFLEPLAPHWLQSRAPELRAELFVEHARCWMRNKPAAAWPLEVELMRSADPATWDTLAPTLSQNEHACVALVLAGCADVVKTMPVTLASFPALGVAAFCEGEFTMARKLFAEARKRLRSMLGKRSLQLTGVAGLCFCLSLLLERDAKLRDELEKLIQAMEKQEDSIRGLYAVRALLHLERGEMESATGLLHASRLPGENMFEEALFATAIACVQPVNMDVTPFCPDQVRGMPVIEDMFRLALKTAGKNPTVPDIPTMLGGVSVWERRLDSLTYLLRGDVAPATQRLVWLLDPTPPNLTPILQTPKGSGWTAGRAVALKRLHEAGPEQDWLSPQDRRVIATIEWYPYWSGGIQGEFNMVRALHELAGHPLILHHTTRAPLILERKDVVLNVRETADGCELRLSLPPKKSGRSPLLTQLKPPKSQESPEQTNVWIYHHIPPSLQPVVSALAEHPLRVPRSGMGKVLDFISANAGLPLHTNLATGSVESSPRPVVRLYPQGNGLRADFLVRPLLEPESPTFQTGRGLPAPMCRMDGRLLSTQRDFAAEREALRLLLEACPTLAGASDMDDDEGGTLPTSCLLENLPDALQALLELGQAEVPETARPLPEWPQGERFRVVAQAGPEHLQMHARKAGDWFRLDGDLTLHGLDPSAEQRVLAMSDLLAQLEGGSGLFVPLGDGQFLALTRQLKRRLDRLRRLSEQDRDGGRRVHPLAAGAIDDLLAETIESGQWQTDKAWRDKVQQLRHESPPALPPVTLKADLRDYQLEGFQWLSRLCGLGAGACLADDMGLGKTVQTLGLLLEQAAEGPMLVVAPMSVCHNWEQEATRFAPTLRVHRLHGQASDRAEYILNLGPGDVLIISYTILQIEQAALATPFWRVIVFDEAQALKNPATKRAKAARSLRALFRLALTGTPIENQLEDLWSLFHILNPGLLGSLASFRKRFSAAGTVLAGSAPGGTGQDEDTRNPSRQALKSLIRPFILRRTKAAVLTELPPRTEQVLEVELPPDERALYEALRRKALKEIESLQLSPAAKSEKSGQRRLAILAELTRLRRACCHPSLIDPTTTLPGAKLEALLDIVRELKAGRHRALIFSQFVGHLSIVRNALDKEGVRMQYLDGSTPEKERQRAVAAFQQGEGDVFLISLKAGGQGINLTAADFVIHLDPWWNPAVEDQASDRAHRLGQERAVTIYRLVARNTVEEKILALHHAKRALAADFLTGADAPLSENELLGLFAESDEG